MRYIIHRFFFLTFTRTINPLKILLPTRLSYHCTELNVLFKWWPNSFITVRKSDIFLLIKKICYSKGILNISYLSENSNESLIFYAEWIAWIINIIDKECFHCSNNFLFVLIKHPQNVGMGRGDFSFFQLISFGARVTRTFLTKT